MVARNRPRNSAGPHSLIQMWNLDYTKTGYQRGLRGHDEYQVSGVTDGSQACNDVPAQKGTTHRWDRFLIAQQPYIIEDSKTLWRIGVEYVPLSTSQKKDQEQESDWRKVPMRLRWDPGNTTEPVD